jgi:hypothetical protein
VTSPSQRPLPDNTQHSQETDIYAPGGIRTHNLSKWAAADPRLRPDIVLRNVLPKYGRFLLVHSVYLTRIDGVTCHKTVIFAQYFSMNAHSSGYLSWWGCYERDILIYRQAGEACHFLSNLKREEKKLLLLVFLRRWTFASFTGTGSFVGRYGCIFQRIKATSLWRPDWPDCRSATGFQNALATLIFPHTVNVLTACLGNYLERSVNSKKYWASNYEYFIKIDEDYLRNTCPLI